MSAEPMMTVCSRTLDAWPFETDSRCDGCRTFPLAAYLGVGAGRLEVKDVKHWRDSDPLLVLRWCEIEPTKIPVDSQRG